jgi:hypothetical protein
VSHRAPGSHRGSSQVLPCRGGQYASLFSAIHDLTENGITACVYFRFYRLIHELLHCHEPGKHGSHRQFCWGPRYSRRVFLSKALCPSGQTVPRRPLSWMRKEQLRFT